MHENVRNLGVALLKDDLHAMINTLAQIYLYQVSTEFILDDFSRLIGSVLEPIRLRKIIQDYRIVCDETNNGPELVDRYDLRFSVFVKFEEDSELIEMSSIVTPLGAVTK